MERAIATIRALGDAAGALCQMAARIEAARVLSGLPTRSEITLTRTSPLVDQPGLLLGVRVATAGELRRHAHRYHRPPVDEVEHPDIFRTVHENCTFK